MHKKSINIGLSKFKSKLNEAGLIFDYSELKTNGYLLWKTSFFVENITIRYGHKNERTRIVFQNATLNFMLYNKRLSFSVDPEIKVKKNIFGKEKYFLVKLSDNTSVYADFNSSMDLFFRNFNINTFKEIKTLILQNDSFVIYEIKENNQLENQFTATNNNIFLEKDISPINSTNSTNIIESYSFRIKALTDNCVYNKNSTNYYIKKISEFGNNSAYLDLIYSYLIDKDNKVKEELNIKKITLNNDNFSFNISGLGSRNERQRNLDWEIDIYLNNYKEIIIALFDIFNTSMLQLPKEQRLFVNNDQANKISDILADLPEAKLSDKNLSLHLQNLQDSDFKLKIGGADAANIYEKLSEILPFLQPAKPYMY